MAVMRLSWHRHIQQYRGFVPLNCWSRYSVGFTPGLAESQRLAGFSRVAATIDELAYDAHVSAIACKVA